MFSLSSMIPNKSLPELTESVRRMLTSMQAQIAGAWDVQHNADGAHKQVTVLSLDSAGLVTLPRFGFRPAPGQEGRDGPRGIVVSPDIGNTTITTAWHFPYVDRAGVIIPDLSSGDATIYGLSVLNRQIGDVVALVNHQGYNADLVLRLNAAGSFDGKFAGNLSLPSLDVTLPRGRWVWLMLLATIPGTTTLRWHVSHF